MVILAIYLVGCGHQQEKGLEGGIYKVKEPTPPQIPSLPEINVDFEIQSTPIKVTRQFYVAAEGSSNPVTKDKVTIKIEAIGNGGVSRQENSNEITGYVQCEYDEGTKLAFPVAGAGIVLTLSNNTGHILKTANSVLQMENKNGQELKFLEKRQAWKKRSINKIKKIFTNRKREISRVAEAEKKKAERKISEEFDRAIVEYLKLWKEYKMEIDKRNKKAWESHSRVYEAQPVSTHNPEIFKEVVINNHIVIKQIKQWESKKVKALRSKFNECVQKITSSNGLELPLLGPGNFNKQTILPGKTLNGFIPLKGGRKSIRNGLVVKIYDLVTETNAAGTPTKRTHFDINLELREEVVSSN